MRPPDTSLVLGNVAEHQGHTPPPDPSLKLPVDGAGSMAIAPRLRMLLHRIGHLGPTVVAGAAGLDRRVLSAVVNSDRGKAAPDAHELLIVAHSGFPDTTAELVCAAHERGVAGVVITGLRDLPVSLLQAATDLCLPVIVFNDGLDPHEVAIAVLGELLTHQREAGDALEDRFASITLEELVSSDPHRTLEAIERGSNLGWDLYRPRAILLASIDPPVDPDRARRALTTIAAAARATLGRDAVVWTRATSVAALLAVDGDSTSQRRQLADGLREELDQRVTSVTLSIGVGRSVSDPTELPTSFIDANRAVDVGRWAKGRHVTELYDELGLERLFASVPQLDLHDFVLHSIGPLLDHDRRHRSELVETLSTWLQARNMAEAARQLYVHYNTFKNRLERIESILGPILSDPGRLLECEVAIYVSRHYDGPWKHPAP